MKRKLEISELIFKILSYTLLTIFAIACLYPFLYTISSSISGAHAVEYSEIVLLPKDVQFDAFARMLNNNMFWNAYTNTLFLTFYGTIWEVMLSVFGAYALSKKRLLFRKGFNFFLVFTMWFSAGTVPQYLNYLDTQRVFGSVGVTDDKWLVVIAMGMAAMNIILLRNSFEGVPSEIEEAAIVDGATEMQVLWRVYLPMSKSILATVSLFFAISRWNGYYWAKTMMKDANEHPLMVYIRNTLEQYQDPDQLGAWNETYSPDSVIYAMIICSIIPILIIYPFIQKYFAKGVNAGGVK
ncbi:MAG: carbohydrate ABC transporter permease [Oscillospiraceae bacterium]|nr:carbohydrate ABC transporter permease [Oscillospiraceae bacterium]